MDEKELDAAVMLFYMSIYVNCKVIDEPLSEAQDAIIKMTLKDTIRFITERGEDDK